MSKYKLIAFDMDGTLLNSKKEISKKTLEMIEKAFDAGKEVILSTGRCVAELNPYIEQIPRLRYLNCVSGALVYDLKEKKKIYTNAISAENVSKILEVAKKEDVLIHMLTNDSVVQQSYYENMDYYGMGVYQPLFEKVADKVPDIFEYYKEKSMPIEKLNLYHHTPEGRERTRERLSNLELMLANAEQASLEISAVGVTKGTGLKKLCEHLGISLEETIAVGDADNDIDVLKTAGLSVAMGNANDTVKSICDVVVSDCDHDGCAEVIEKYFLSEE